MDHFDDADQKASNTGNEAATTDADRIRHYVLESYIEPARTQGRDEVDVLVRDVNEALSLNQAWPNICQALTGRKFLELAGVAPPEQIGADHGSATIFRFNTDGRASRPNRRPFVLFDGEGNEFQPVRHFNRSTGISAFRIKPRGAGNTADEATEVDEIREVARAMLVDRLASRVKALSGGPVNYLTYGGQKLVRYELDPEIAREIGVPSRGGAGALSDDERKPDEETEPHKPMLNNPVSLILYGPPGTGKTFATAAEAVRLCGENPPKSRAELMDAYQRLSTDGRIEFVTFHQSMSYEDFVEGLRPTTEIELADDEQSEASATGGFRLKVRPGLFKVISERARLDTGDADTTRLDRSRPIYKVALGQRGTEESLIREALDQSYIHIGWGEDIDWSDARFDDFEEIRKEWNTKKDPDASGKDPNIELVYAFRSGLQVGDYVLVSDGRDNFRAFGEVTGEYEFHPEAGSHPHRRRVEWIWRDEGGTERATFYPNMFRRHSVYRLNSELIDWDALEKVVIHPQAERPSDSARPYVLIIDEINRANISKVFGELITLLEADKRLGCQNELRVRLPYSGTIFGVPPNLHIVGTMNTADRSIALLDTALRRRFTFREMMPEPDVLAESALACGLNLPLLLSTLNERIEYLYDREHQIGHAYFTSCTSRSDVDQVMRHKVIPLLAEYFFEDWEKIAAVLGDASGQDGPINGGFVRRIVLPSPPGFDDQEALPRFRWLVRSEEDGFDYSGLLKT